MLAASAVLLLPGCGSGAKQLKPPPPARHIVEPEKAVQTPPWQTWAELDRHSSESGASALGDADNAVKNGQLDEAVRKYELAYRSAASEALADEAFLRQMGTLLRMGNSQELLRRVTDRTKSQNRSASDVSAPLALVVAFAYYHRGQPEQSVAWFGSIAKRPGATPDIRGRASTTLRRVIGSLKTETFEDLKPKWQNDDYLAALFSLEDQRRQGGGAIMDPLSPAWFLASSYGGTDAVAEQTPPPAETRPVTSETIVGVLLPLSGEFVEHASRVREGIDLAARSAAGKPLRIVYLDEQGNPDMAVQQYEQLVRDQAAMVLGPMLVKTTEAVGARATALGVPLLSFTKKEGITEIGPNIFRLGATTQDQSAELVQYVTTAMQLKSFAVAYPNNPSGLDFLQSFKKQLSLRGLSLTGEAVFDPRNRATMTQAVRELELNQPQAIFVPETIENSYPLIELIKASPGLAKAVLLGPAQWDDPVAIRGYSNLVEGAVYVTPFFAGSERPVVVSFANDYREAYQREPELLAAQAFDAMSLTLQALTLTPGADTSAEVSRRLKALGDVEGVTGKLTVAPSHEVTRRMSVLRLHEGIAYEVMAAGETTGFVPTEKTAESPEQLRHQLDAPTPSVSAAAPGAPTPTRSGLPPAASVESGYTGE